MALQDHFQFAELEWLVRRVRKRVEAGRVVDRGALSLKDVSLIERRALARVTGLVDLYDDSRRSVRLEHIDAALRNGPGQGLRELVELALGEGLVDRRALRQRETAAWSETFADLRMTPELSRGDVAWLDDAEERRRLRRRSRGDRGRARELVDRVATLARHLPAADIPIAVLAADLFGDAHALDRGQATGDLAARFILWRYQQAVAVEWRDLWDGVGVLCDDISTPVLVLNLRAEGDGVTAAALALYADAGEPTRLSARALRRDAHRFTRATTGGRVFVCENPSVLAAAADRLGVGCAPVVCIEGQPRTPARIVLDQLAAAGIELHYHGDFDWPGIRIANLIIERHGATAWRMDVESYRAVEGGVDLEGAEVAASWDATLVTAMQEAGRAVHEEQVLEQLLADLRN